MAPFAKAPMISQGPMIQPKSANQKRRSPGRQSNWSAASSATFTVNPAWTCTAPFGRPVVPDDLPAGMDEAGVRRTLLSRYGIEVGGGLGAYAGKVWRIGCMGHTARPRSVTTLLGALDEVRR